MTYDPRYLAGVLLFNGGCFFEAHEVWEDVWAESHGDERRLVQGLIQAGLPEPVATILADADARSGDGAVFDESRTLSRLIGRPTTPWRSLVAKALAPQQA